MQCTVYAKKCLLPSNAKRKSTHQCVQPCTISCNLASWYSLSTESSFDTVFPVNYYVTQVLNDCIHLQTTRFFLNWTGFLFMAIKILLSMYISSFSQLCEGRIVLMQKWPSILPSRKPFDIVFPLFVKKAWISKIRQNNKD